MGRGCCEVDISMGFPQLKRWDAGNVGRFPAQMASSILPLAPHLQLNRQLFSLHYGCPASAVFVSPHQLTIVS